MRVTYWRPGADHLDADALDLGRGGLFLCTGTPLPRGAHIAVQIELITEERPWSVFGRVVWTRERSDDEALPSGMGVQFLDVDDVRLDQLLGRPEPEAPRSRAAPVLDVRPGKKTMFGVGRAAPAERDGLAGLDEGWVEATERADVDPPRPKPFVAAAPPRKRTIFGVGDAPEPSPLPGPAAGGSVELMVPEWLTPAALPAADSGPPPSRRTAAWRLRDRRAWLEWLEWRPRDRRQWLILSASIAVGALITFLLAR